MPTLRRRISPSSSRPATICTSAQHHQGCAPADQLAQHAARRLAEHDAQDLPRDVARQHRLTALVGHDVADPGDRHRNDGGAAPAPARKRTSTSGPSVGMAAETTVAMPAHSEPSTTILSLPRASLSGPTTTWNTP